MVFQLPTYFLDPFTQFIVTTMISGFGVVAAILVAQRYGEKAASELILREQNRKEHTSRLIAQPLECLKWTFPEPSLLVTARSNRTISNRQIELEKSELEVSRLLEHPESGYGDLYKAIIEYVEKFNGLSDRIYQVYDKVKRGLGLVNTQHPFEWEKSPADAACTFSIEVHSRIEEGTKQREIRIESSTFVKLGGNPIGMAKSEDDALVVKGFLDGLFENDETFGCLQELWREAVPLTEKVRHIQDELEEIRVDGLYGVRLQGSCSSGRTAKLE